MSTLIAIAYPDRETAERVRQELVEATKEHLVRLEDAVIVECDENGKVKLRQAVNTTGAGAAGGAAWGGLIGLLFLAPLFGMAIGAASGAAAGHFTDTGVDDDFMKKLGAELDEGNAAVVLLIREVSADKVLPEIKIPGTIIQTSLSNEDEGNLQAALDAAKTPAG
jgi:uncharacterized membrane protein